MEQAVELAGFAAAHAVWCVAEGEALVPMAMFQRAGGGRELVRFEAGQMEEAVSQGRRWLSENQAAALAAVFVYDGFVNLPAGKSDALALEVRAFESGQTVGIVLPYRHANRPGGFAVHRPKFRLEKDQLDENLGRAFFGGVALHEKGSEIWNACLDETE